MYMSKSRALFAESHVVIFAQSSRDGSLVNIKKPKKRGSVAMGVYSRALSASLKFAVAD